jgi:hypothetical protein
MKTTSAMSLDRESGLAWRGSGSVARLGGHKSCAPAGIPGTVVQARPGEKLSRSRLIQYEPEEGELPADRADASQWFRPRSMYQGAVTA